MLLQQHVYSVVTLVSLFINVCELVYFSIPKIKGSGDSVNGLVFWGHKWINETCMGIEVMRESRSIYCFPSELVFFVIPKVKNIFMFLKTQACLTRQLSSFKLVVQIFLIGE